MSLDMIRENVKKLLQEIPSHVNLVAAAKARSAEDIGEALTAGVRIVGENYVQEAEEVKRTVPAGAQWHLIGHLQKNKVKKAAFIFDMIETVDSLDLAVSLNAACAGINKVMAVLIEINSGRENQKFGIMPENAVSLVKAAAVLKNIKVTGLMTVGIFPASTEVIRKCFRQTREVFDNIGGLNISGVEMRYLSMGMTDSYHIAIEEGANMIRIGSGIFGEREKR